MISLENIRIGSLVEIDESKLSSIYDDNPNWKYDDEIAINKYGYKFICKSLNQLESLMSITDPSIINKCSCGTLVCYGYVLAFKIIGNKYELDEENFAHCDNCHNIWDGNAQCNCYEICFSDSE